MKEKKFVNKKYTKKIVMNMFLIVSICLSMLFFMKILTNISIGAENPNVLIEGSLEKYINFNIPNKDKGTLVQYNIKSGVEQQTEVYIPIQKSELAVSLNQIDGKYPYSVKVIAKSTEVTNGQIENIQENYQYDAVTGVVTIKANNVNDNGDIINSERSDKNARDEYIVICYYDTYIEEAEERELNVKVNLNVTFFEENAVINQEKNLKGKVKEDVGALTSLEVKTEDVYNGYIKSNIINGTSYKTVYKEVDNITISKKDIQEKISIFEENTIIRKSQKENEEEITEELGNNGNVLYKSTKIKKEDIVEILGVDGTIEILDMNNNTIATIDKYTEFQQDGTVIINYENAIESIIIKTSEIQNEGILEIENTKEINSTMLKHDIDIKKVSKITGINEEIVETGAQEVKKNEIEVFVNSYENIIDIKDSHTNIDIKINNTEWTNKQQNEVVFDVYANSNNVEYNMLKNPTIKIELPKEVEKVILGESSVVYANGLQLQNPYLETNENGNIVIVANLIGEQITYDENTLGLMTDVRISATVILRKDIENVIGNINLIFANNYTLDGETELQTKSKEINLKSYTEQEKIQSDEKSKASYMDANIVEATAEELKGVILEVAPTRGDTVLADGDIVYEGEFIKYNIKVTNTTDKKIDNIKVVGTIPEGTTYGELEADYYNYAGKYEYKYNNNLQEKIIEIGTLEAGESITKFYEVKIDNLQDKQTEKAIETSIVSYVGINPISNYKVSNVVKKAEVQVFLGASLDSMRDKWNYGVTVTGDINSEVILELTVPKEFEYIYVADVSTQKKLSSDKVIVSNNKIQFKVKPGYYLVSGMINSNKITEEPDESKVELKAHVVAKLNEVQYFSNENRIIFEYESASIVMTSPTEGEEVRYKDEIEYDITINNTGRTNLNQEENMFLYLNLIDYLPKEVNPVSVTYETWEKSEEGLVKEQHTKDISIGRIDEEGNELPAVDIYVKIPYKKSVSIKVKAIAGVVSEKTKIENSSIVSGNNIESKISNIITHTILPYSYEDDGYIENPDEPNNPENPENPDNPSNPDNPDNPDNPSDNTEKYSISGVVWLDENEDGKRQAGEKLLNNITAILVDTNNSSAIKAKQLTDEKGYYSFSGLNKGKYIVVFQYDTDTYSLTTYRKSGVATSMNSDATDKEINLLGTKTKAGLTDIISLDASIQNIDMGLIKNKICDLKLDKYISKVIVKTAQGLKEHVYNNTQLAKVEIREKEIQGATVVIEYKLVITNEGEIPTSVNKVIDYLPEGLEFSSELNKNWNIAKNGELTNISILNQKIEPGKSIELPLVLTKIMTKETTGTFTNIAEIGEINNSLNTKDIDSMPGNKAENEDDYSKADLIISVSTGKTILFISFFVVGLIIIAIYIKFGVSKVLKVYLFTIITVSALLIQNNIVNAEGNVLISDMPKLKLELTKTATGDSPSEFTVREIRSNA